MDGGDFSGTVVGGGEVMVPVEVYPGLAGAGSWTGGWGFEADLAPTTTA